MDDEIENVAAKVAIAALYKLMREMDAEGVIVTKEDLEAIDGRNVVCAEGPGHIEVNIRRGEPGDGR